MRLRSHAAGVAAVKNRRTKITVETQRVILISDSGAAKASWCDLCGALTEWVKPDDASAIVGVSSRTIYRWVEDERVHFVEMPPGPLLLCFESLCECSGTTRLDSERLATRE
jgi:hypothetical protein